MIKQLIDYDILDNIKETDCGLFNGIAGALIYISKHLYLDKEKDFYRLSSILIRQACAEKKIEISDGLLGIGLSYIYCLSQKNVSGNCESILKDLDSNLFKDFVETGTFVNNDIKKNIEILFYLSIRLQKGFKNQSDMIIYRNLTIALINKIYSSLYTNFFKEGLPFSLINYGLLFIVDLVNIYRLSFYKVRIQRIMEELSITIASSIPCLQSNRLNKLTVLLYASKYIPLNNTIKKHINILENNISLDYILNNEMNGSEFLFSNGICGIFLLTILANNLSDRELFPLNSSEILNKIDKSPFWERLNFDLNKMPIGINGISGLKILIEYLN